MVETVDVTVNRSPITIIEVYKGGSGGGTANVEALTDAEILAIFKESGILSANEVVTNQ